MRVVNHQNYYDNNGKIYCKKEHKVMNQDIDKCSVCDYCSGSLQGEGVECSWEDNVDLAIVSPDSPEEELMRVSLLIDSGVLKKG